MTSLFKILLDKTSIYERGRSYRNSIERFNYASSKLKSATDVHDRIGREPQQVLRSIHQDLCEAGFTTSKDQKAHFLKACQDGHLSCEQAVFLYLALLSEAGLDLSGSLANDKLSIVTMFNPKDSHVALCTSDQPNYFWETTLPRSNQQPSISYARDFDYSQRNNLKDTSSTMLDLFCLDLMKKKKPNLYLASMYDSEAKQVEYPSKYFYSIEIINQLAEKIVNEKNSITEDELNSLCTQAIKRLEALKSCPYLKQEDIQANIDWFREQSDASANIL